MHIVPLHDHGLPAGIELYRLDLDVYADAHGLMQVLTPAERLRAGRFARRADRARFVQTRVAARRLLARRLGCRPCEVPVAEGLHGKPFVEGGGMQVPAFNVSHAGSHALVALASACEFPHLGVDIERCREDLDVQAMLDLAFTPSERAQIAAGDSPSASSFYLHWVGKEAVLKAIGVGVAEHLRCISIQPSESGRLHVACDMSEWAGLEAMALCAPPGYAAAVAWQDRRST